MVSTYVSEPARKRPSTSLVCLLQHSFRRRFVTCSTSNQSARCKNTPFRNLSCIQTLARAMFKVAPRHGPLGMFESVVSSQLGLQHAGERNGAPNSYEYGYGASYTRPQKCDGRNWVTSCQIGRPIKHLWLTDKTPTTIPRTLSHVDSSPTCR